MRTKIELQKRIKRKEAEITELRKQLSQAEAYLQGMVDTLKLFPKDGETEEEAPSTLRAGSQIAMARDAIRTAGKPLHISDLVRAIGKEPTKRNKLSLSGSLGDYVRRQEVFTRPKPNTFGLKEMEDDSAPALTFEELAGDLESEAH